MPIDKSDDNIISKIEALLATADSLQAGGNDEAAETYRAKADKMMRDYAVEMFQVDEARRAKGLAPEQTVVDFDVKIRGRYIDQMRALLSAIVRHNGGRVIRINEWTDDGEAVEVIKIIGFKADMEYSQLLFTSLHFQLATQIEPKADPSKGYDENVYDLHEAGIRWMRIRDIMNKPLAVNPDLWEETPWPDGLRLRRAYYRHCKTINQVPRKILSPDSYQRSFADAFVARVRLRLSHLAKADSTSTAVVLKDRTKLVEDHYNVMFPPGSTSSIALKQGRVDAEGARRGREAGDKANLNRPGPALNRTGDRLELGS